MVYSVHNLTMDDDDGDVQKSLTKSPEDNKENMNITESDDSHGNNANSQQDSNGSMQLNLEETQSVLTSSSSDPHSVSLLQQSHFPSPKASPQKLKMMEREKNSPRSNLDDSVIIEDTPEKENKNLSVINISDSSPLPMGASRDGINLILDNSRDHNKSSGSVREILSSSMSEILLGQNNLLYQECDNIDKVLTQLNQPELCETFFLSGY